MASTQAEAISTLYQSWTARMAANPEMDIDSLREMLEMWHTLTAEPEAVTYAEADADGTPALWCIPVEGTDDRAILLTHGGGYVMGSRHSHRKFGGHLARAVGCRVLVLDYRRAPEHPHPAQVEDAARAYRWLLGHGFAPEHLATLGDSAGGSLATRVVLKLRDEGEELPAAIVCISPWYDTEAKGETVDTNAATDHLASRDILLAMAGLFLGGATAADDPSANALYADPKGLPPIYLLAGGHEALLDDSRRFAAIAEAAGVEVTCVIEPEMQHVFSFMAGKAPEADAAIAAIAKWLRPNLGLQ